MTLHRGVFGKHLVSVAWFDQPIDHAGNPSGKWRHFSTSGFIMSFAGQWCLITAGHVLAGLDEVLEGRKFRMWDCVLHDAMGSAPKSTLPIPFDCGSQPRFYEVDDAVDCGAIRLSPYFETLMRANGNEAFAAEDAERDSARECDEYLIMGIPTSSYEQKEHELPDGSVGHEARSLLVGMPLRSAEPPDGQGFRAEKRAYYQPKQSMTLAEIDGMSGSPVFCLHGFNEQFQYTIVAIQFAYHRTKISIGCPVRVFVPLVREWLASL
jgi:hypothetical protein